jgi:hypothetical protein
LTHAGRAVIRTRQRSVCPARPAEHGNGYLIERFFCVRFEAFFGAERDSDCSGLRGGWSPMIELTGQTLYIGHLRQPTAMAMGQMVGIGNLLYLHSIR